MKQSEKKPLSVSGYNTYVECADKFDKHYNKRIRPIATMSYFTFGSAIDKGLNALLEQSGDANEECMSELKRLLKEPTEFIPNDYDGELIPEDVKKSILKKCKKYGYKGTNIDSLVRALFQKPYSDLSDNQKKVLSTCCYESLKIKSELMIIAYKKHVLPKLKNIGNVQKEYRWSDKKGNDFLAKIDFTATYNGFKVTPDNKTSSNPARDYGPDSVRDSMQLSAYCPQTGTTHGAYFVMSKQIQKNRVRTCVKCGNVANGSHRKCEKEVKKVRCNGDWEHTIDPRAEILIRVDEVPKSERKITQEALTGVAEAVKAGQFPKNLKSCRKQYGPKTVYCPYYNLCRNGSMKGLEVKPPDKKEEKKWKLKSLSKLE